MVAVNFSIRMSSHGLLVDELLFVDAIEHGFVGGMFAVGSSHPPLIKWIVGLIADGSSPDWLLRLPSLLFSVANVFVWFAILKRLVKDQKIVTYLLPTISLSPVWMTQGFQCLPYSAMTFFASLHCLAWLLMIERDSLKRQSLFVFSGAALPWTHFFGINVLVIEQLMWWLLLYKKKTTWKTYLLINGLIASLTLPVLPFLIFYLKLESTLSIFEIDNFSEYFMPVSSLYFTYLAFSKFTTTLPLFLIVYGAAVMYVLQFIQRETSRNTDSTEKIVAPSVTPSLAGCIAILFFLAGFGATQGHSLLAQKAMWPRYMLVGAWIHLPLITVFLLTWNNLTTARAIAGLALICALLGPPLERPIHGENGTFVARHLKTHWSSNDFFLAQGIDIWSGENQFDRLWFRRYVSEDWPVFSDPPLSRQEFLDAGLTFEHAPPVCNRIWVYSHYLREDFFEKPDPPGWKLVAIEDFGDVIPLALYQRENTSNADKQEPVVTMNSVSTK